MRHLLEESMRVAGWGECLRFHGRWVPTADPVPPSDECWRTPCCAGTRATADRGPCRYTIGPVRCARTPMRWQVVGWTSWVSVGRRAACLSTTGGREHPWPPASSWPSVTGPRIQPARPACRAARTCTLSVVTPLRQRRTRDRFRPVCHVFQACRTNIRTRTVPGWWPAPPWTRSTGRPS